MRAQRPFHLPVAIDSVAERLPFGAQSFDASMAAFTVHQWPDLKAGLAEMRRVTKDTVLILASGLCARSHFGRGTPIPSNRYHRDGIGSPDRGPRRTDPVGLHRRFWRSVLWPARMPARPFRPPGMLGLEFRGSLGGGSFCGGAKSRPQERRMGFEIWAPAQTSHLRRFSEARRQSDVSATWNVCKTWSGLSIERQAETKLQGCSR
jgi:hypothetical protein